MRGRIYYDGTADTAKESREEEEEPRMNADRRR